MLTTSVTFTEESAPQVIAQSFNLRDFDSSDSNSAALQLTVTLTHAVDGTNEGLSFYTAGTSVTVDTIANPDEFSVQYVLRNATSYAEYQQVSLLELIMCVIPVSYNPLKLAIYVVNIINEFSLLTFL